MRCEEFQEQLVSLLYDEEDPSSANRELQDHLLTCPACRREFEELKQTRGYLREWKDESPLRSISIARQESLLNRGSNWRYMRYAAIAAMALICLLAVANAEFTWTNSGFTFRTSLFRRTPEPRDYYTKAEIRNIMKRALDDSESRTTEANYVMLQQMLDTVERDHWMDLRLVRGGAARSGNKN